MGSIPSRGLPNTDQSTHLKATVGYHCLEKPLLKHVSGRKAEDFGLFPQTFRSFEGLWDFHHLPEDARLAQD